MVGDSVNTNVRGVAIDVMRAPPQSIEAEQAVLGGLLLDNNAWDRVVDVLTDGDFYRGDHRLIFQHMARLIEGNKAADALTVCESLERVGKLEDVGGRGYVGELAFQTPSAANVRRYAEIVRERSIMRSLAAIGAEIADRAYGLENPGGLAEEAEGRLLAIRDSERRGREPVSFHVALGEAVDEFDEPERGLSTGFTNIDAIARLKPGELWIIAGRPSMGKSALVGCIGEHLGASHAVSVFSLEMTRSQWAGRSLAYHSAIIGRTAAVTHLLNRKICIDDSPAVTLGYIRARARRLTRQQGLDLIIVDYLQLMTAHAENRTQEISAISRGLKAIAKEFDVPVIAVSQLSRAVENRTDHRPIMADLRESGQIEQDADVIGFVYRDEVYNTAPEVKGLAELIVRKNRNGPIGTAHLSFAEAHTRFTDNRDPWPCAGGAPVPRAPRARRVSVTDAKSLSAGEGLNS
jgi:replicative DNA helicase